MNAIVVIVYAAFAITILGVLLPASNEDDDEPWEPIEKRDGYWIIPIDYSHPSVMDD